MKYINYLKNMYISIVFLPFLAAILSGIFGRSLGVKGVYIINITCLCITTLLSFLAFYEVVICNSPVSIELFSWIKSEHLNIGWSFYFDELTVSMLIPVLIVSVLVHLYSIGYMGEDPHQQRFFSYISLFTGLMLVLVTGNNFLVMFLGWEGMLICLKWYNYLNFLFNNCNLFFKQISNKYNKIILNIKKNFFTLAYYSNNNLNDIKDKKRRKLSSYERIGPHNIDIISIIIGSTLGDTHLEKRKKGIGTRIIFEQCSKNVEYLMWFHKYLSIRGYCSESIPKLKKRIKKEGTFFSYRVFSYTFSSLNWLHSMFYSFDKLQNKYVKIIPLNIEEYLTPLALAIWFMDDGSKCGSSAKIATNSFTVKEILFLSKILIEKYSIKSSIVSDGRNKGYCLYIYKCSMPLFSSLIKRYMLPSLYYKLNGY